MSGIALFVPREEMVGYAHKILQSEDYGIQEIRRIETSQAVREAQDAQKRGINIIIARGYQASLIKKHTDIPVVEIALTGQEMGLLITRAKQLVTKENPVIAIVGPSNMFCDMTYFDQIFQVQVKPYLATDADALNLCVSQAIYEDPDIIIGGDTAIAAAARAKIPALFMDSTEDSLREAFKVAKKLKFVRETEKHNMAQMDILLDYSFSGIIKMDSAGIVLVVNHSMEEILDKRAVELIGRPLQDVVRDLDRDSIEQVLSSGDQIYSTFLTLNNNALVVNLAPILVEGRIDGAILTCHKVKKLEKLPSDLLRERYLMGLVAQGDFDQIPQNSAAIKDGIRLARLYAQSRSPVLIHGEIGTERETFAQAIHRHSLNKNGPFITINCHGMDDDMQAEVLFGATIESSGQQERESGALAIASQGTLLISEIDHLSLNNQYRLYKAIRYKSLIKNDVVRSLNLDVRIIATTSRHLDTLVEQGLFRADLYYLLNGLTLDIPPLRERREDIGHFLDLFTKRYFDIYARFHVLTAGARKTILDYNWEGNIIQLESFCERMILTASHRTIDEVFIKDLMQQLYPLIQRQEGRETVVVYQSPEAIAITQALENHQGNRELAAAELGISKTTLWRYMKKYGISSKFNM